MNNKRVNNFCESLFSKFPKTVGIFVLELNCGCAKLGGCTKKGDQSTPIFNLSSKPISKRGALICLNCLNDGGGINRVLESYLVFKKGITLSKDEKTNIASKVFGI